MLWNAHRVAFMDGSVVVGDDFVERVIDRALVGTRASKVNPSAIGGFGLIGWYKPK